MKGSARRGGVTLVDLLVVILIICLLSGLVFSAGLGRARETQNRVNCAANLHLIGLAIQLYSNENKGMYPRTVYKPDQDVTQYTGVESKDPFGKDPAPKINDITAAIFLLIRTQDITSEVFICPATDNQAVKYPAGKSAVDFGNFKSEENLSYSLANVYPGAKAVAAGYKVNATNGAEIAIVADMNPGTVGEFDVTPKTGPKDENAAPAQLRKANSMNHRGEGQNVLYGDGHVEWQTTPFCGQKGDNIYTVSGSADGSKTTSATISGSPAWAGDSVLLPAATVMPHRKTPAQEETADAEAFKKMLPSIKQEVADEERQHGQTPQLQQMKVTLETMEKELADYEGRKAKGEPSKPANGETKEKAAAANPSTVERLLLDTKEGRIKHAKGTLSGIRSAMDAFEVDNGRFPTTAEGLAALVKQPPGLSNWHGPYVEDAAIQADPWGHPYIYRYPGKVHPNGFDLISTGPDGRESADDISQ